MIAIIGLVSPTTGPFPDEKTSNKIPRTATRTPASIYISTGLQSCWFIMSQRLIRTVLKGRPVPVSPQTSMALVNSNSRIPPPPARLQNSQKGSPRNPWSSTTTTLCLRYLGIWYRFPLYNGLRSCLILHKFSTDPEFPVTISFREDHVDARLPVEFRGLSPSFSMFPCGAETV